MASFTVHPANGPTSQCPLCADAQPFLPKFWLTPMVLSDRDRDLMTRCLAGDDGAWEDFIDRYLALLTHVVTGSANLKFPSLPTYIRDDIVAEILLALVDNDFAILRRFREQSSLGTYLVVIARRITVRRLSRIPAAKSLELDVEQSQAPQSAHLEDSEEVQQLLSQMENQEATVIRLFHLEHQSYSDIGEHLGIPENSVGPLLSRARKSMRMLRES